ncbi:IclR family transcriptional regulator domain-containing protein [Haloterrigena turkmenica]
MIKVVNTGERRFSPVMTLRQYTLIHASAVGKAVLAENPMEYVHDIIEGLRRHTQNTLTDRKTLLEELKKIREWGYATTDGESRDGIQAAARVVQGSNQGALGSISIYGPTYNFPSYEIVAETLLPAVDELEEEIRSRWKKEL